MNNDPILIKCGKGHIYESQHRACPMCQTQLRRELEAQRERQECQEEADRVRSRYWTPPR